MLRKILLPLIVLILGYGFWISPNFKEISAGVAVFLFGMLALEDGFKLFSGGLLESFLKKATDRLYKSIGFGVVTTTLMQSSSLVSVLTISFLSAGLIGLTQGIGIIFGANLGTTTGAWLIAGLGLKVKISAYAMPMLTFGILFVFQKNKTLKGVGYILAGLGFLFLGIAYMKEGFETFKDTIDLSVYAVEGLRGLLLFMGIGVFATVVMQSSHATLVLIITALAAGQITYENALALAIGANIGTTITAIIGSMGANIDGKRLAGAHLIFNLVTGAIAITLIHPFMSAVESIAQFVGIAADDYTLKLALFHTLFNLTGVIVMTPFIGTMVRFLKRKLKPKSTTSKPDTLHAKYLNPAALELPTTAMRAVMLETQRLFQHATRITAHGIGANEKALYSNVSIDEAIPERCEHTAYDIDEAYSFQIKDIYGEIFDFAAQAQSILDPDDVHRLYSLKITSLDTVEAIKALKHLQKNLLRYCVSDNPHIREQYQKMVRRIAKLLRRIRTISTAENPEEISENLRKARRLLSKNEILASGKLDKLIRHHLITNEMATSLINDNAYVRTLIQNLIVAAEILYAKSEKKLDGKTSEPEEDTTPIPTPNTASS
jgi:phosphate:Na+ symporter